LLNAAKGYGAPPSAGAAAARASAAAEAKSKSAAGVPGGGARSLAGNRHLTQWTSFRGLSPSSPRAAFSKGRSCQVTASPFLRLRPRILATAAAAAAAALAAAEPFLGPAAPFLLDDAPPAPPAPPAPRSFEEEVPATERRASAAAEGAIGCALFCVLRF